MFAIYILCIIGASLSEPHIDELNVRNLYIYVGTYVSNLFHPRAAIYIVQQLAIYSGGRMKKLLRSPVPRAQSLLSQQNRLPAKPVGQVAADSDRDLGYAPALPGMPTYLLK